MKQFNELNEIEKKQRSKDKIKKTFGFKNIITVLCVIGAAIVLAVIFSNIYSTRQQKRLEAMQVQNSGNGDGNSITINWGSGSTNNSNEDYQNQYKDLEFEFLGTEIPPENPRYYLDTYFTIKNPNKDSVKLWFESMSFNNIEVLDSGNFEIAGESEITKEINIHYDAIIAGQLGDTIDEIHIVYYIDHFRGEAKVFDKKDLNCVLGSYEESMKNNTGSNKSGAGSGNTEEKESTSTVTSGGNTVASSDSGGPDSKDFSAEGYVKPWYDKTDGDYNYWYILAVTNNSDYTVAVNGNAVAKNKEGKTLAAAKGDITVLGPGETEYMELTFFSLTEEASEFEYSLSYEEETLFEPVVKDIEIDVTENPKNVIITAKNTGSNIAGYVSAYVIFLDKNDNVVYARSGSLCDSDLVINPGESTVTEIKSEKEYDHAVVILDGRKK